MATAPPQASEDFVARFERGVKATIERFAMVSPGDKTIVAVSGGKDSLATLYMLKKFGYPVEAVTIDLHIGCYTAKNLANVRAFCAEQGIPLRVFTFRKEYGASVCYLADTLKEKGAGLGTCTVCGVLRRRLLNKIARECGATKLATGHNLDDEAQAHIMNMLRNRLGQSLRLHPMSPCDNGLFVPRIKPLYLTRERDVERYTKTLGFPVQYGRCPCSKDSMRSHVRALIAECEKEQPDTCKNVVEYFLSLQGLRCPVQRDIAHCERCGEPASGTLCRGCGILAQLHSTQQGA